MKVLLALLVWSFFSLTGFTQVSNIRSGLWSDPSVWESNSVPASTDDVILHFDIVIDVNASCESFNSNSHNVVVSTGANLTVLGNNATKLTAFVVLDAASNLPFDTVSMMLFYYDNKNRNTGIDYIRFIDGKRVDSALAKLEYFYNVNDTIPYKKTAKTPYNYPESPFTYLDDVSFFFYENGNLVKDSFVGNGGIINSDVTEYSYTGNKIIDHYYGSSDTNYITYNNGNIQYQVDSSEAGIGLSMAATYDDHPNPFSKTQARFGELNY